MGCERFRKLKKCSLPIIIIRMHYSILNYCSPTFIRMFARNVIYFSEVFRYSSIRTNLIRVVFPENEKGSTQDKYFNPETALELFSVLHRSAMITKEAKEEIDAIRQTSNIKEKMERFRTLLETEENGVLEATVDHLTKDDYDVAASLKLIDTGELQVLWFGSKISIHVFLWPENNYKLIQYNRRIENLIYLIFNLI